MNYDALLITTTEIGFQLLKNGAETYRVEDSVTHVLKAYSDNITDINVFAIPTCLIISITTKDHVTYTKTKRILNRLENIDRIVKINSLCRYITDNKPDIAYIDEQLEAIGNLKRYPFLFELFASCLTASTFTLFYKGTALDAFWSVPIAAIVKSNTTIMKNFKMNFFTTIIFNSFIIAMIAVLSHRIGFPIHYDSIIIGCYMLLVPGVAITNSARDYIAGDLLSGTLRLFEAFLIATFIALGSGIALALLR